MNTCFPSKRKISGLLACAFVGALTLTGCKDSGYDLDEVDLTIGLGGDSIELPTLDTDTLWLDDVLEINEDGCVEILDNGDYVFLREGDDVEAAHPLIDPIRIEARKFTSSSVDIPTVDVPAGASGSITTTLDVESDIASFSYSCDTPDEVEELQSLTVDNTLNLEIRLPQALRNCISSVDRIVLTLPSYLHLASVSGQSAQLSGHQVVLSNVSTAQSAIKLSAKVDRLTHTSDQLGSIAVGEQISIDGRIRLHLTTQATLTAAQAKALGGQQVTSSGSMPAFYVTGAEGRFSPDIDLHSAGDTYIDDMPDFLNEGDVVLDLYNPQIILSLSNDMPVGGTLTGTLTSYKDGQTLATVRISETDPIVIKANGTTTVCISRQPVTTGGYDQNLVKSDLADLIRTIPDRIAFETDATPDGQTVSTFRFGHTYTVKPAYSVRALLQFGAEAMVAYTDSVEDMNEDLQDYDVTEGTYVEATAELVNCAPVFFQIEADAYDIHHQLIPQSELSIEVSTDRTPVAASADGRPVVTPVAVKVSQTAAGAQHKALKQMEGLRFRIVGYAKSPADGTAVEGVTINSKKQYLIARDVHTRLIGKVIADLNDDDDE